MSTRLYPIYNRGNPQLRVFLPNFWMKLVKAEKEQPSNVVQFQTSVQMTHHDVRNYLEKIYKIPVVDVKVEIMQGKTKFAPRRNYIIKDDDYKLATITLPKDQKFEFPNLFPKSAKEELKQLEEAHAKHQNYSNRNRDRPGVPGWFSF